MLARSASLALASEATFPVVVALAAFLVLVALAACALGGLGLGLEVVLRHLPECRRKARAKLANWLGRLEKSAYAVRLPGSSL